jgi:ATP-binding cassette, subfamily B, multidrug efflux pump
MHPWLWAQLKKYKAQYLLALCATMAVPAINLVNPLLAGILVDRVIIAGERELLLKLLGTMVLAVVLKAVIRYSYQMAFERASQHVLKACREELFSKLQRMDFGYYDRTKTGDIMAHLTGDLDAVRHFVAWVVYQIAENVLMFTVAIIALFFVSWKLTLALLIVAPPIGWLTFALSRKVKPTFAAVRAQFSRLNSVVQENIAGNRVVRALTREDYETGKFQAENGAYRDRNVESAAVWARYIPPIEFFSGVLPVVLILIGGTMIVRGSLTLGQLVTFNGLVWAINQPLRMAGWLVNDVQRYAAAADRLDKLFGLESALPEGEKGLRPPSIEGRVEFRGVSFSYGDEAVLEGIDFSAEPGQTIGILGPTGSGKSSIGRLICRYYDRTSGEILVDGVDVRDYDLDYLRANVGVAMQDVFLFSDTIEGNIAFGSPSAPIDDVIRAAEMANAHDFVKDLDEGYDTIIGERGVGLSGGQRQRVALARLLLASPPVMVLDDTTSSVDIETEERIQESIRSLRGKKTVFIIAHRVSSIMHADQILVIRDGRVAERGTHGELRALGGYYDEVYRHQAGDGALAAAARARPASGRGLPTSGRGLPTSERS